jgi:transcription elongation factor Elf1
MNYIRSILVCLFLISISLEARFACRVCPKDYSTKGNLTQHIKCKHLPNPTKFRCPKCSSLFVKKSGVKEHVRRIHDKEPYVRNFKCSKCDRSFTTRFNTNRHQRTCTYHPPRTSTYQPPRAIRTRSPVQPVLPIVQGVIVAAATVQLSIPTPEEEVQGWIPVQVPVVKNTSFY